jgi:hypothetical protein
MVFANMVLYIAADSVVNKPIPGMKRTKASRGILSFRVGVEGA